MNPAASSCTRSCSPTARLSARASRPLRPRARGSLRSSAVQDGISARQALTSHARARSSWVGTARRTSRSRLLKEAAMAIFDAFLKIEGITGEHKGEIQLESFSWGVSNPISRGSATGGAGAGKIAFQDFTFTSRIGRQSTELFMHAAQGTNFRGADLTINGRTSFLKVSFFDVFISSYKQDMTH